MDGSDGDNTPCDDAADRDTLIGGDGDDDLWGNCGGDWLDGQGGTDICRAGTPGLGGPPADHCDYVDCETYSDCEENWSWD